jgi:hypothetical protein
LDTPSQSAPTENTHATGFSQWLVTKFSERRIYSAFVKMNRHGREKPRFVGLSANHRALSTFSAQTRNSQPATQIQAPIIVPQRYIFNWCVCHALRPSLC